MIDCAALERIDKTGEAFQVTESGREAEPDLICMYDSFGELGISQGLPPANREVRLKWIDKLLEFGKNFLASKNGSPIGHCCVIPDFKRGDAEYIIFVQEPHRNKGIGAALTELALKRAKELGISRIWLTVEAFNFRAIRLYRNAGFHFVDDGGERERTMVLRI
jgi:RimJ/RimL family protein N-acetyltransferase